MNGVKFVDNSAAFKAQMERNIVAALTAAGELFQNQLAPQSIRAQPRFGPGATGAGAIDTQKMLNSNAFQVNPHNKEVLVGNTAFSPQGAPYPLFVDIGTWKMPSRPWLRNAIFSNVGLIQSTMVSHLGAGFAA